MAHCDNCNAHVTEAYHRVFSDNQGKLHACSHCHDQAEMLDGAGVGPQDS